MLKALGILGAASVAGSGTALGAQLDSLVAAGRLTDVRSARLFTQVEKLTASDAAALDNFGVSVSASADGSMALVGAHGSDDAGPGSGSAYVYDLSQDPPAETKLTASDAAGGAEFAFAVSMSGDGNTALVGASGDNDAGIQSGAAYVYDLRQDPPTEMKLTASDAASGDIFGYAVSLSGDGNTVLVGAWGNDDAGEYSGSAYVYDLCQDPPTETKLTATDAAGGGLFGWSVSVSADGTTALVGAPFDDAGSMYVYDLSQDPPTETKLTATDASADDFFAFSVSVSSDGNTALVGASGDDGAGAESGSAYVYDLCQDPPTETKLTATDAAGDDLFGHEVSVSADGTTALIGAYTDDDNGRHSGSAYVFELEELAVFPEPIVLKNGKVVDPQDLDGDGLYEDFDGDGDVDGQDVSRLRQLETAHRKGEIQLTNAQVAALDFDGDGEFTKKDIAAYRKR